MKLETIAAKKVLAKSVTESSRMAYSEASGKIYSERAKGYVDIRTEPKGNIQKYNLGLSPGSWY